MIFPRSHCSQVAKLGNQAQANPSTHLLQTEFTNTFQPFSYIPVIFSFQASFFLKFSNPCTRKGTAKEFQPYSPSLRTKVYISQMSRVHIYVLSLIQLTFSKSQVWAELVRKGPDPALQPAQSCTDRARPRLTCRYQH